MKSRKDLFAVVVVLLAMLPLPSASAQNAASGTPAGQPPAQWTTAGAVTAVNSLANGDAELVAGGVRVRITAISPTVVRVHYLTAASRPERQSFAVIAQPTNAGPKLQVKQSAQAAELNAGGVRVRALKPSMRLAFLDTNGNVISEDAAPVAWNGSAFRVFKSMPEDEHYFGLGEKSGPIDHRDQAFTMWNTDAVGWVGGSDPLYQSIPFFLTLRNGKSYGIFLDNTYRTSFEFGKRAHDQYSFGSDGGDLDYYFFYGPDPKKVIEDYTALVGRMPLPPLFTLGYHQSRYSYLSEARVREVAHEFRTRKIPADVIFLDIDYEDGHRSFTFNPKTYPNPAGLTRDLAQDGFKIVTIVDLHLAHEPGYAPYDDGHKKNLFVKNPDGSEYVGKVWPGDSVFPDFTWKPARDWWGSLFSYYTEKGVRGFWNDMNEPSVFRYPDRTMPLDTVHRVGEGAQVRKTDHREIHNVFGLENVRGTYEGLLKLRPDQRPFVLTRASYAGAWRYAATWTGDNQSTWEHFRLMVPTLLTMGLSGYGFVGADIGGFGGSPTPELLTRWIALGVFTPYYRNHTTTGSRDQEPWVHGPEHEAIRRRFIETRYRLLPYIYTGFEEMSRTGVPIMRPLFLEYPDEQDRGIWEHEDLYYFFGRNLLVVPKLIETVDPITVKLPPGAWYDFWTGAKVQENNRDVNLGSPAMDQLPVFVREGSIIPLQPVVQHVEEKPQGPLTLEVFPGADCRGSLYADDGNTFAYRRGEFYQAQFTCQATPQSLTVRTTVASNRFQPWWSEVQVVAMGAPHEPKSVTAGGQAVSGARFDAKVGTVTFTLPAEAARRDIVITY